MSPADRRMQDRYPEQFEALRVRARPDSAPPDAPRIGDFTSTFTGRRFWPLDPRPEDIDLRDIARALSMQCRWGGHVREFISVAQHSVLVAEHLPVGLALRGLLHDAAEAYLVDVPSPIKKYLIGYGKIEARLLSVIGERFGIPYLDVMTEEVRIEDVRALATEQRDLRKPVDGWEPPMAPWREHIYSWSPSQAEGYFRGVAASLGLLR